MRDPVEQLRRIQNALVKIAGYVNKGRHKFDEEEDIRLSTIYYLQTISVAARTLALEYREHHPDIPWQQLIDFQNYITYYYRDIDLEDTWKIVHTDLPNLKPTVDALLTASMKQEKQTSYDDSSENSEAAKALRELLQSKREDILRTATTYGVSNLRVFGSVARGEADTESDIDLLVDIEPGRTLFDLEELMVHLQNLLGRDIDIVTEKSLNDQIRSSIIFRLWVKPRMLYLQISGITIQKSLGEP